MQRIIDDPTMVVEDMLRGYLRAHSDLVSATDDPRVMRYVGAPVPGKVGIVTGGGSGHKPAFVGYLGRNMVDAVAVGEIFSSPSASAFLNAFKAADSGAGVACPADVVLAAGTECRTAAGVCDVAEACDGAAALCPTDMVLADGEACADGMVCNGDELCASGACASGTTLACDDSDPCTADACAEPGGCMNSPIAGCVADAGMPDGGMPDGGMPDGSTVDSGTVADAEADAETDGALDSGTMRPEDGGCSCGVPGGSGPASPGAALLALVVLIGLRRRRS